MVIRNRGGCQRVLNERQLQHLTTASRRRVLKALQALPLQALHLACESGPFAMYDVPAWPSGRPSRLVFSSAAGLIITVTDGEGEVIEREAGCATGLALGPVAHDGGRSFRATVTSAGLDGADLIRWC
jgi:hypothetical protein